MADLRTLPSRQVGQFGFQAGVQPEAEAFPVSLARRAGGQLQRLGQELPNVPQQIMDIPSALADIESKPRGREISSEEREQFIERGVTQVLDFANPIPMGLGTIIPSKKMPALLDEAQDMLAKGKTTMKAITDNTGHYMDWDGNWKTQIPDVDAQLTPLGRNTFETIMPKKKGVTQYQEPLSLGSVYKHNALYELYPEIATKTRVVWDYDIKSVGNLKSFFGDAKSGGKWARAELRINPDRLRKVAKDRKMSVEEALMDTFNHESNHIIQAIEKLPGGSTPAYFKTLKTPEYKAKKLAQKYKLQKLYEKSKNPQLQQQYKADIARIDNHLDFMENMKETNEGILYTNTLGEADAFWSQAMRKHPDPAAVLPLHQDPTQGRMLFWGEKTPFDPTRSAITRADVGTLRGVK